MRSGNLLFLLLFGLVSMEAQEISLGQNIFTPQEEHTHGSTIVELPNGDLLVAWFQGTGERWADDVRIMGARLRKGESTWTDPFLMADVPDFPDINPVLFLDSRAQLWLVWYTVIANQWETSLLKYRISRNFMQADGPPQWAWQDVIHVKPGDPTERGMKEDDRFVKAVTEQFDIQAENLMEQGTSAELFERWIRFKNDIISKARGENMIRSGERYPYFRRMGWQTKNKATMIGDRILLPLYSDGLEMSLFAITDDFGEHWQFSTPLVGIANIQASVAQKEDGTLIAYMRDNGPAPKRHPKSFSKDQGLTWSPVVDSDLPNPGSGSDVVTLENGHWVIAYNDTEKGRHSLAVALSTNEGESWEYRRHLELDKGSAPRTASYPSVINAQDGQIHLVYSYTQPADNKKNLETIRYIRINEDWIKQGDRP